MDWLFDPINKILEFLFSGIYTLIVDAFAYMVQKLTLGFLEFTLWSMSFAWDVASSIIQDLGLNDQLNSAWNLLPPESVSVLTFFGVPNMISILLTAFITAYTLKFIPFSGK